jgi:cytochrome c553
MKRSAGAISVWLASVLLGVSAPCAAVELPAWAYPVNPPEFKPTPDDGSVRRVPGSSAGFTLTQLRDLFLAPDWHPDEHPSMPEVVARGRQPDVFACGFCHRASGTGGPENASIAGLPDAYIVQQMADYKTGARSTALPKRPPQALMIRLSKAITDEEVAQAATYFSSLGRQRNIRVVESDTAPQTFVANWLLARKPSGGKEALGQRIVEVPEDLDQFESRDSRATFVAYVPVGSLAKGEALVGGRDPDRATACSACHGKDLKGVEAVPSIAGRSPSYIVRQLHEFQSGIRAGPGAQLMKDPVARLGIDDMISIAAYLASLAP